MRAQYFPLELAEGGNSRGQKVRHEPQFAAFESTRYEVSDLTALKNVEECPTTIEWQGTLGSRLPDTRLIHLSTNP